MGGEWQNMPFSEAVSINPKVRLKKGKTYPFVDMAAVNSDARCAYMSEEREFKGGGSRFQSGDTLLARITPCLENGKIARYCATDGAVAHGSTEFIVIRGRDNVSTTAYAYYLTTWEGVRGYAISQMTGTSGRQRVPTASLDHLEVPLPPFSAQLAIGDILGTLDDKIELNRQMNHTLEAMARAIFKVWFVDFEPVKAKAAGATSFRGMPQAVFDQLPDRLTDTELGPVPEGWDYIPIGELVDVIGGGTPSTKDPEFWEGGEHAFCTPKDLSRLSAPVLLDTERHITQSGIDKISSRQLPVGTVILSSRAPIGYLALAETPVSVNQGIIAMVTGDIPNTYILLWTEANMEVIESRAGGSTFAEISKRNFRPIPSLRPNDTTLCGFGDLTEPLFERIASNERESHTLAVIRDTLLPKLISGELRVEPSERSTTEAACR